ncbi:PREDICTED: chromatin assembly factor 1 subunit FAS1 [Ipomoea nil]|uniref:chromatin assembly factor 1 subunit FAS1 n=1 Tax=Ipomoea nil TaxID=35883 RepID=UPI0009008C78|nr:PREDICTED: chromatin assembly factor 1 subunit FAS1 [Ipomoea nil]
MAEPMIVDVVDVASSKGLDPQNDVTAKKTLKRKRASSSLWESPEEKEAKIKALREETEGLFRYYREVMESRVVENVESVMHGVSMNSTIACLMEESSLPLSKLVDEIFAKINALPDGVKSNVESISKAGVKSAVILVGQRLFYGIPSADADVLEDESETALWCWETRDVKLLPKSVRPTLRIRRTCRKKIHERISAVSAMLAALDKPESHGNCSKELMKASEKLCKVLTEADIRLLVDNIEQKSGAEMAEKETKSEKFLIKQLERSKREAEKEKKRVDKELQKEKLQSEKELKRLQHEAEKEEKRREREESELRKQLKKQQEEAEKDQRRKEKEESELKKQLALQKQASLMERFLKKNKSSSPSQSDLSLNSTMPDLSSDKGDKMLESVTTSMDSILSHNDGINAEDLWRSHLNSWHGLGHLIRSNGKVHWGIRRGPRTKVVKELKLTTNKGLTNDDELSVVKLVDRWVDSNTDSTSCHVNPKSSQSGQKKLPKIKLLQFDKSHRPAFYGVWPKKSEVIRPCCPFKKDPELDYEIDSDEEWEEEEPGESLSDCDKDEVESLDEECARGDDEESEDGFFVPDGYLSEDEGVQVDKTGSDVAETKVSPSSKQEAQTEEFSVLRQQKYLNNLTEHALRKNQPLVILNFMHEKASILLDEDVSGNDKVEQLCMHALRMCSFPGQPSIEISCYHMDEEVQEAGPSNSKMVAPSQVATTVALQDSDLPQVVSVIRSCSHGINKVVESLQSKFPHIAKSQLRSKVREISDFSDNRWQVKKDILVKLGLSVTPEKVSSGRTKSIAAFFSKRCLPPSTNPNETSPQPCQKTNSAGLLQESENKIE